MGVGRGGIRGGGSVCVNIPFELCFVECAAPKRIR